MSELELKYNQWINGNNKAFNTLFHELYTDLCRFAYTYVKNEENAEEIVQNVFIELWEQRTFISIRTSVRSYLFASVRNRSLNFIRDNKTRKFYEDNYATTFPQQICQIIDFCEKEELQHIIEKSINELPEQCRIIFEMSRNQNLTYSEIAEKLSISPKTVENQMSIALKKLRIRLSPYLSCMIAFF